ncbi:MAG: tripartite tricarboxylate transporter TctB family protein [Azoarcus sp.]|nr:tripartite tricarboxylate transporter TctB family protein [Azoarcus sp.]
MNMHELEISSGDVSVTRVAPGQARHEALSAVARRDLLGGAVLCLLGGLAAWYAQRYQLGTATRMGPGFFPTALGLLLCLYGGVIAAKAVLGRTVRPGAGADAELLEQEVEVVEWRNLFVVAGGLVLFAVLLTTAGLAVATLSSVLLYTVADRGVTVRRALMLSSLIALLTVVVFVWGLRVSVPVWWI